MVFARTLVMSALTLLSAAVVAEPCDTVVEDTIAEMRAGAGDDWSSELERAVRAAAGSACVKAQSGRYQERSSGAVADEALMDEAVQRGAGAAADSTAGAAASQVSDAGGKETEQEDAGDDEEEGFSIGGLTIRGASGSPSKKSYERARADKTDE